MSIIKPMNPNNQTQCTALPNFEKLNYYYGQSLGVADFLAEQQYFINKQRLHNRCLHGWGIVCGLQIKSLASEQDCTTDYDHERQQLEQEFARNEELITRLTDGIKQLKQSEQVDDTKLEELILKLNKANVAKEELLRKLDKLPDCSPANQAVLSKVLIECGMALDCLGRELIVNQAIELDLWKVLDVAQRKEIERLHSQQQSVTILLNLCYCEQGSYPSRPVINDSCSDASTCVYGRIREGVRFKIDLNPEDQLQSCQSCCQPCQQECVTLAKLVWPSNRAITQDLIDLSARRLVSLYQATVITAVSWAHGGEYSSDQAKAVLGTKNYKGGARTNGIEIQFSQPVYAETIKPGVIDLWRIQLGEGVKGSITHIETSYVDLPESGLIERVFVRDETGETLNDGDRVLISIYADHILDHCCQAIDGNHVGGMVPQLDSYKDKNAKQPNNVFNASVCADVAMHRVVWTSGNGVVGGTFQSWFHINETIGAK